jgi:hypothetical protein
MSKSQISDGNTGSVPSGNQQISDIYNSFLRDIVQQEMAECWRLKVGEIDLAQSKESAREHETLRARQWHKLRRGRKQSLRP